MALNMLDPVGSYNGELSIKTLRLGLSSSVQCSLLLSLMVVLPRKNLRHRHPTNLWISDQMVRLPGVINHVSIASTSTGVMGRAWSGELGLENWVWRTGGGDPDECNPH